MSSLRRLLRVMCLSLCALLLLVACPSATSAGATDLEALQTALSTLSVGSFTTLVPGGAFDAAGIKASFSVPSSSGSVSFAWSIDADHSYLVPAITADGKILLNIPEAMAATTAKLTVTATKGSSSQAKTFDIPLSSDVTAAEAISIAVGTVSKDWFTFAPGDSAEAVTGNFTLPVDGTLGTAITWTATDSVTVRASIAPTLSIAATGAVSVSNPPAAGSTVTVTLTPTVKKKNSTSPPANGSIVTVVVKGITDDEAVLADKNSLASQVSYASGDSASSVNGDFSLPLKGAHGTTITWVSDSVAVAVNSTSGLATTSPSSTADTTVTLTGTVSKGTATSLSSSVTVTVKKGTKTPTLPAAVTIGLSGSGRLDAVQEATSYVSTCAGGTVYVASVNIHGLATAANTTVPVVIKSWNGSAAAATNIPTDILATVTYNQSYKSYSLADRLSLASDGAGKLWLLSFSTGTTGSEAVSVYEAPASGSAWTLLGTKAHAGAAANYSNWQSWYVDGLIYYGLRDVDKKASVYSFAAASGTETKVCTSTVVNSTNTDGPQIYVKAANSIQFFWNSSAAISGTYSVLLGASWNGSTVTEYTPDTSVATQQWRLRGGFGVDAFVIAYDSDSAAKSSKDFLLRYSPDGSHSIYGAAPLGSGLPGQGYGHSGDSFGYSFDGTNLVVYGLSGSILSYAQWDGSAWGATKTQSVMDCGPYPQIRIYQATGAILLVAESNYQGTKAWSYNLDRLQY